MGMSHFWKTILFGFESFLGHIKSKDPVLKNIFVEIGNFSLIGSLKSGIKYGKFCWFDEQIFP